MSARISSWRVAIALTLAVAATSPAAADEIVCGQTLVRALASGPQEIGFHAREGEVVSATVVPLVPLPGFDPRWRIADVEGRPVELSMGDHRCKGRCETAPLPRGNAFTLRIADSGVGVGAYVVSFEAVSATADGASNGPPKPTCARTVENHDDGTRALPVGEILDGLIDLPGETDTFTLSGTAGASLHVILERSGGLELFAPVWTAFDAHGTVIGRVSATETEPLEADGVVTILVTDASLLGTGGYELHVDLGPPSHPTTSTTLQPGATTSTTTTLDGTTTTAGDATTTSTTTQPGRSTTTTTLSLGTTTTSTAVPIAITTTSTAPGATTTLPPAFDLETVVSGPTLDDQGMLGGALAFVGDRLLIGAPHENVGRGRARVRDAGAVLIVDVEGAVGSPTFARVLARVVRPDTPTPGDELGATLAPIENGGLVVGAPAARTAYVFANAQLSEAVTIPPPSSEDDGFGSAVAAPDGLVAVGAPRAEGGTGVVYLFDRVAGAPGPVLRAPTAAAGARFGAVVAASGSRVLIGAPGGASVPGRAFLFDAATGTVLQTLTADPPAAGDEFGAAVGFAGDDLLIGAPGVLDGRGRVDRFDSETGKPTRTYAPVAPSEGARFGAALAVGDGRLVVGAPGGDGAAFVYDLDTGVPESSLDKPMPQAGDGFGTAVAIGGGRVYVGAPGDDAGTVDGGAVFAFDDGVLVAALRERLSADAFGASAAAVGSVFWAGAPDGAGGAGFVARIDPAGVAPTETVLSPDAGPVRFGASVAALGDLVVAGAPESPGAAGARVGAVHLFDSGGLRNTIQNPSPGEGDEFGFAVGSLDGDVLASAPFAGAADTGLVYRVDATGRLRVTYGKPAPAVGDFFGAALAGDQGQVLVGAPLDASGGAAAGAVYLFDGATAAIVHMIPNPDAAVDLFGASVALGQWIVVGAPRGSGNTGGPDGVVWVFDRATGALVRKLDNPRSGPDDNFGAAVALVGERLLVGAPLADDRAADTGLVYLFEPTTGQLLQTFRSPPQGAFDNFGFSIAAGASGLLIGSPGPSRVYVFDPIPAVAGLRTFAAPLAVTATATCGNGLVEGGEACDDGNGVDTDDCRNDCTSGICCTLDAVGDPAGCDDGDRCTADTLDPVLGCQHKPNGAPGCCESDADCPDGQCRLCVGCFVYRWDCCDTGSTCVPSNAECVGKTCVDAAFCQCEGKLDCGGEPLPDALREPFGLACNTLRLQVSVTPDGTPVTKPELVIARQATRSARVSLRKAVRMARHLARTGEISKTCRKSVIAQVRVVRQAIPRGRKLRRCLLTPGG